MQRHRLPEIASRISARDWAVWVGCGQEGLGGHDHARRAVAALDRAEFEKGQLQVVRPAVGVGDALDGDHLPAVNLGGQQLARIDHPAVEDDRAGAALADLAAGLGAGQAQVLAQQVQEGDVGRGLDLRPAGRSA